MFQNTVNEVHRSEGGAAVTSIILFKDSSPSQVAVVRCKVRHSANDNIRSMEFDIVMQERNWCSLAVFSSLLLVGTLSIASPFFSILAL